MCANRLVLPCCGTCVALAVWATRPPTCDLLRRHITSPPLPLALSAHSLCIVPRFSLLPLLLTTVQPHPRADVINPTPGNCSNPFSAPADSTDFAFFVNTCNPTSSDPFVFELPAGSRRKVVIDIYVIAKGSGYYELRRVNASCDVINQVRVGGEAWVLSCRCLRTARSTTQCTKSLLRVNDSAGPVYNPHFDK